MRSLRQLALLGLVVFAASCTDEGPTQADFGTTPILSMDEQGTESGSTGFAANVEDGARVAALVPFTTIHTRGNYVAAGVGLRGLTSGNITISGIPAGATVQRAYLYWGFLDNGESASLKSLTFAGHSVTGTLVGSGPDTCWGRSNSFAYRADVTSAVAGNGTYSLTNIASGGSILAQGTSLVVIYHHLGDHHRTIALVDGDDVKNSFLASISNVISLGGAVSDPTGAKTTYMVGDGQSFTEVVSFTGGSGTAFFNNTFTGSDGSLWDTRTLDVSAQVAVGDVSVSAFIGDGSDCLMWVAQAFSAITHRPPGHRRH